MLEYRQKDSYIRLIKKYRFVLKLLGIISLLLAVLRYILTVDGQSILLFIKALLGAV